MERDGTEAVTAGGGYTATPLVEGFPGKSASHGAFGWSSLWLLDDGKRRVLIDAGQPAYIPLIHEGLARLGLTPADVTDVLITHLHWDHVANFTMFANATTWVGEDELAWAAEQPAGTKFIPDLHVQELLRRRQGVERMRAGQEVLPGIHALASPGHTPHHLAFFAERTDDRLVFAGDAVKNLHELTTLRADSSLDDEASTATIDRLRSLLSDTAGLLVPGHDVGLALADGAVHRVRPQRAEIGYFADAEGEQDRSIG
ncbi:MBL fold metallo-hydrolase [Agromyces mediolanus]|jgi:glyoxylase-like metal-dependent hydrolase (beta-lactamase superfamily II)|uniref:MBL fold metallo-hydrolase n=1 Tax=Agromyces mediolanus TaxID=41986 RepID=UPI001E4CDD24|nr:MBL fold metallo-hydrolase [Agromyces mediolanus]MCD1569922.1 MBL fold metallo-hydrolase [Agromyces mediolanus]